MSSSILYKADSRGQADHGWLKSAHSFSFANYYDPERMNFGALRVLNDDMVDSGGGFGEHPHDNMEIISIPLEGNLEHADSMNNHAVIKAGDIQVMSAGTGIRHSEHNESDKAPVKFLQIWISPNQMNVEPRYAQKTLVPEDRHNKLELIISPDQSSGGLWIYQDSYLYLGKFDAGVYEEYKIKSPGHGLYVFVLDGSISVGDQELNTRDGYGLWDFEAIKIVANTEAEFVLIEVPME